MKNITTAGLILPISVVTLLCSCLVQNAQTYEMATMSYSMQDQGRESMDHCHASNHQNADSKDCQDCGCGRVSAILSSKGFDVSRISNSTINYFGKGKLALAVSSQLRNELPKKHNLHFSDQAFRKSIPIYLQDSVLRL